MDILLDIKNGAYLPTVEPVRRIYQQQGKTEQYRDAKKKLKAPTFAGMFSPTRGNKNLKHHTGFAIIDLDNVLDAAAIKTVLKKDKYIAVCFLSPSGDGLKALVPIPFVKNDSEYKQYFAALTQHFLDTCQINIGLDESGKDINRLCFVSYDPDIYINPNAEIFTEKHLEPDPPELAKKTAPGRHTPPKNNQTDRITENALNNILNLIYNSTDGNRHDSRLKAANLAGGYIAGGLLSENEILQTLETAVRANTTDFKAAWKTIQDGIEHGKKHPLTIEKTQQEIADWIAQNSQHTNGTHTPAAPPEDNPDDDEIEDDDTIGIDPETGKYNLTELGNSLRFIDAHNSIIRFNHTSKKWHIWDGTRWAEDLTDNVHEMAKQLSRLILLDAAQEEIDEKRKKIVSHSMKSESQKVIANSLKLASSDQRIAIRTEAIDQNQYLFNILNGTIELNKRAFVFRSHSQNDNISKIANVTYNPDAKAPRWERFLDEVFITNGRPDKELIEFIQSAIGVCLTGDVSEQYLFFCYGMGKNGKSTFFETLRHLFGDYYQKAPTDMLMTKKGGQGIPNDIARLVGTRFVVASEIENGRYLAESVIKDLTGGDRLTARFMRQDYFEFDPTHKLWIYGNHKPNVKSADDGIWRRLLVIPFTQTFAEPDKDLKEKLIAEISGILNWALVGYERWRKNGLIIPNSVLLESKNYRDEMNNVRNFLEACCDLNTQNTVTHKKLFEAYLKWCNEEGETPVRKKDFKGRLMEQGLPEPRPGNRNMQTWIGAKLTDDAVKWLFPNDNGLDF